MVVSDIFPAGLLIKEGRTHFKNMQTKINYNSTYIKHKKIFRGIWKFPWKYIFEKNVKEMNIIK